MAGRKTLPKGVTIRKNKHSESIQIAFVYKGVQCRETLKMPATAGNLRYAERLRHEVYAEIERGTFNYDEKFPGSKTAQRFGFNTRKPFMKELFEEAYRIKCGQLKPSSLKAYSNSLKAQLLPTFGHLRIDHLTPKMIRDWVLKSGLSARTLRNHRIMLDFALSLAVQDRYIERSPLEGMKLEHLLPKERIKSEYEPDPFNQYEINALISAAVDWYRPMITTWLFTGMRPGELIALTWEDINFDEQFIDVNKSHVLGNNQSPKTDNSIRLIDMLPPVYDALLQQKRLTFFLDGEKGHVFRFQKSKKPFMDHRNLGTYVWKPTIARAGIRYRNQYQARHTFASQMLTEGEDILWVAKQLGHRGTDMLNRVYGRWIPKNSGQTYKPRGNWNNVIKKSHQNHTEKDVI
ncbi:MAG: site-specific integrase [Marinobacterium sp.]|nr:site-specific integrase [Marinobacterium sp.]